ncbi:MAG: transport permease protein [Candidatus Poseidoniales archaeon]|nr:MAG: transport permease protein [Candidatus Poseidoniales archaeon]
MGRDEDSVLELHAETPTLSAPFKMFQNLREYRHLLRHFISRDLKTRYPGSIIGWGWSIAEPLALTVTFYILFAILSDSTDPYRPFNILVGILAWTFFSRTFSGGTTSLQRNSGLIQRIYFPREIFLFSGAGFQLVQMLLSMIVLIPLLYHYDLIPTMQITLLPSRSIAHWNAWPWIGILHQHRSNPCSGHGTYVTVALRIGFYLTPVFYNLDMITQSRIPAEYSDIYLYTNPMATYLTMIRCAFTGEPLGISNEHLVVTISSTILIFLLGSMFFMRKERKAVKNI